VPSQQVEMYASTGQAESPRITSLAELIVSDSLVMRREMCPVHPKVETNTQVTAGLRRVSERIMIRPRLKSS
jgi:hypothetical protein